jgi:SAM-dependent methyltransferase
MNASPFVERLRDHASRVGALPPVDGPAGEEPVVGEDRAAAAVAGSPALAVAPNQLAFWQSPVARAAINRRITGDPELGPETHFARRHGPAIVAPLALSLRASDAKLELALVEAGACERLVGLDDDQGRVDFATGRIPEPLREQVRFQLGTLEQFQAPEPLGAVVCRSFLHRRADLEDVLDRLAALLAPGGLVFVEDFVGPARFQWTDAQLDAINRLLARLPEELLADLAATDGRRKRSVERPDVEAWIASNPNDAVRSDEILPLLDARLQRVEVCPYGGAIFHQLFSRIMGNFAGRPELVGVLMEVDALLTDTGLLDADYVWGVWRRP